MLPLISHLLFAPRDSAKTIPDARTAHQMHFGNCLCVYFPHHNRGGTAEESGVAPRQRRLQHDDGRGDGRCRAGRRQRQVGRRQELRRRQCCDRHHQSRRQQGARPDAKTQGQKGINKIQIWLLWFPDGGREEETKAVCAISKRMENSCAWKMKTFIFLMILFTCYATVCGASFCSPLRFLSSFTLFSFCLSVVLVWNQNLQHLRRVRCSTGPFHGSIPFMYFVPCQPVLHLSCAIELQLAVVWPN